MNIAYVPTTTTDVQGSAYQYFPLDQNGWQPRTVLAVGGSP